MLSKLKGIDVAFYIFLLTGFGYLTAFLFGWGYNSYFGIPIAFIDLSVANVTKSIALLGVFFTFIVMYVTFFQEKSDIKTLFKKLFFIKVTNRNWNIALQIFCIVSIIFFLFGWFLVKDATRINFIGIALLFGLGYCHLKKFDKLFLTVWLVLMLIIPYMVGVSHAMKQEEFYLVGNQTDYLVIDFYNDKAIAAKFNKKQKILYPNFKLISVDSIAEDRKDLKLVRLDKLKVQQIYSFK